MTSTKPLWLGFAILLIIMFSIDLGLFNRKSHEIKFKEALIWTIVWVSVAMAFNGWVYYMMGAEKALQFLAGYLIEESLSVDNLFVFIMIFSFFQISKTLQPKILKWGIIGALLMRGIFILVGIELIETFHWMIYIFGGILIITGIKMGFGGENEVNPEKNLLVRLAKKLFPVTKRLQGDRFFVHRQGILAATPLFLTLLVIESSDIIFAVDSIPAVLAISKDPFIVYTSNVFAILGLRSLFYLLANVMDMFVYLKLGVSCILCFVGIKMILTDTSFAVPIHYSLGVIFSILAISILFSVTLSSKKRHG